VFLSAITAIPEAQHDRMEANSFLRPRSNIEICRQLKYIKSKKNTFISLKDVDNYPDSRIVILCTGAQGEADAVLMKIANREHRYHNP
jgi:mRNA degradation ribonuclease J1/J2